MDVSVKSLEGKLIVVEHFDKKKKAENWISVSNSSDGLILPENKSGQYEDSENYLCVLEYEDQENNSGEIAFDNHQGLGCNATNYSEVCSNEAVCTKQTSMVSSTTVSNSLYVSSEINGLETANSRTNHENTVSVLDVTGKASNNGCEITNETERINKILVTNSETNDGLTICTIETDELLITCKETSSSELSKRICPSSVMKSEERAKSGGNQLLKIISEIEMFFDAVNSTNKDMQRKSGILLQKQNLVDEIISYIQAVQSVNRLSTSRNLFTGNFQKDSMVVYHSKSSYKTSKASKPFYETSKTFYESAKLFYEAGEKILEELGLYRRELQEDFKVWEAYRKEILEISDKMLDDFEYCEDEMSAKVLMHEISTRICNILRHMEMITSRRENKNENCIELMESVDTYIRYSSAFIMGNRTLHYS